MLGAIGIDHRDDPDVARIEHVGDLGIATVVHQVLGEHQRDLQAHVLAGVVVAHEDRARLAARAGGQVGLVAVDVHGPQIASFGALADGLQLDHVGVAGFELVERVDQARISVKALVAGGKVEHPFVTAAAHGEVEVAQHLVALRLELLDRALIGEPPDAV